MASDVISEVGGILHNDQTYVPLHITLNEIYFFQEPVLIKTDNSAAEVIIAATVRQKKSKQIDMIFYWMKDRAKQTIFLYTGNWDSKTWAITSQNITHDITIKKMWLNYLYMKNSMLKFNPTDFQLCVDTVSTYRPSNFQTVM